MPGGTLTAEALEALLARLGPDRHEAARRYDAIRVRLTRLFAWRACRFPEELADETIDRVATRFLQGAEITSADPWGFFAGVAYNVFREQLRAAQRQQAQAAAQPEAQHEAREDPRLPCLETCLQALSSPARDFILRYHEGEGRTRIDARVRLGEELGLAVNALRVRAHRIRQDLETCIEGCTQDAGVERGPR